MSAASQREASQKMSQYMKERGIYHGKRLSKPMHANYPAPNEIGSAAYRRLRAKQQLSNR